MVLPLATERLLRLMRTSLRKTSSSVHNERSYLLVGPFDMCSIEDSNEGDIEFLVWVKYIDLEALYDFLAEKPTNDPKLKWKRIAIAREICRREQ